MLPCLTEILVKHSLHIGLSLSIGWPVALGMNPNYVHTFEVAFFFAIRHMLLLLSPLLTELSMMSVSTSDSEDDEGNGDAM